MTIAGGRADNTIIERATGSVFFRLIHVASIGTLKLEGLTLQGGNAETNTAGGSGIFNRGGLTLSHMWSSPITEIFLPDAAVTAF